jgi:ribonuclease Z
VDILYHESTFAIEENWLKNITFHSKEAATIALKANVKQLILGHYSTRYENIKLFKEAQTIFPKCFWQMMEKVLIFYNLKLTI